MMRRLDPDEKLALKLAAIVVVFGALLYASVPWIAAKVLGF